MSRFARIGEEREDESKGELLFESTTCLTVLYTGVILLLERKGVIECEEGVEDDGESILAFFGGGFQEGMAGGRADNDPSFLISL